MAADARGVDTKRVVIGGTEYILSTSDFAPRVSFVSFAPALVPRWSRFSSLPSPFQKEKLGWLSDGDPGAGHISLSSIKQRRRKDVLFVFPCRRAKGASADCDCLEARPAKGGASPDATIGSMRGIGIPTLDDIRN